MGKASHDPAEGGMGNRILQRLAEESSAVGVLTKDKARQHGFKH